jgi:hypothetical protein
MPGPEPPVVNGLQIDQALEFQRRFQRVQRIAWRLLALVPVAAVAGLFGGGVFSTVSAGGTRAGATVSYERFARRSVETELALKLARPSGPANVAITRDFLDRYAITEVRPEPRRVATLADRVVFSFAAGPRGRATFSLEPKTIGSGSGTVTVSGGAPVRISQFVYP